MSIITSRRFNTIKFLCNDIRVFCESLENHKVWNWQMGVIFYDPSAGSPTEIMLRLILPLDGQNLYNSLYHGSRQTSILELSIDTTLF
jgi:hypothetical protein